MCGIAGYKCFGSARPGKKEIEALLVSISSRGRDATGVGYIKDGKLYIGKEPLVASAFIRSKTWESHAENIFSGENQPNTMILHARARTQGDEKNPKNNHPVFNKETGTAVVHNGIISNDDDVIKDLKWKREGEVDSEAVLAALDTDDPVKSLKRLESIRGSMSIAAISMLWPDVLILGRHGNPLCYGFDERNDILYFGSTSELLYPPFVAEKRGFKYPFGMWNPAEDEYYIIGPEGIIEKKKLFFPLPKYGKSNSEYGDGFGFGGCNGSSIKRTDGTVWCYRCNDYTRREGGHTTRTSYSLGECVECKKKDKKHAKDYRASEKDIPPPVMHAIEVDQNSWKKIEKGARKRIKAICKQKLIHLRVV